MCSGQKEHVEDITYLCTCVMKSMKMMIREQLKDYDLTFGEFDVLMFLAQGSYDTSKDIARERGYSRSMISKMVDRLMKQDYLTVQQDQEDRRIVHLKLTPKANVILDMLKKTRANIDEIIQEAITPHEREIMINALKRLQDCLDEQQIQKSEDNI